MKEIKCYEYDPRNVRVSESFRSYAECFYAERHYAERRVYLFKFAIFSLGDPNHKFYAKVILYDNK